MQSVKPSVSTNQKLQLVHQIREEQRMNQSTVRGREELLYGRKYYEPLIETEPTNAQDGTIPVSTFRLRFALSLLLFGLFFVISQNNTPIFGVMPEQIHDAIERDHTTILFDFIEEIPYTLHE